MKKKILSILLLGALMVTAFAGCSSKKKDTDSGTGTTETKSVETDVEESVSNESSLKGQNVRVVIGSTSTSGDSYMIADIVTRYLAKEMGFNGKVDAIGNSDALSVIQESKGDGKTVMMFHDMAFMSVLFGAVSDDYALENMTVGPRIGQNPGGCYGTPEEKEYKSLDEITKYLKENPKETVSFNIEAGGTSHIAFCAYYLNLLDEEPDVAKRVKVIVGGTTAEKLQRMWDRNTDVIFGDVSAFEQYTKDGVDKQLKMNMFGSVSKVNGVDITSMAEEGVTYNGKPFDFAKDFAMYFPKDMDASVLAEYEAAMQRVTENPEFIAEMNKLYYIPLSANEVTVDASKKFIYEKRDMCQQIIEHAPDLDTLTR